MKVTHIIIYIFFILANLNCSVNTWDVKRYKSKFETHKKDFEKLVNVLKDQKLKIGYPINENELPENIQSLLKNLDIIDVNINTTQCTSMGDYQFTSSWCTKATLYFSKDACNKEQTNKGYHSTDRMIEVWGIGDGWTMWIDHDFI